jgi:hypothetical protein
MVSVLAIGLKVSGFKTGRGYRFLTAIKIRSTASFAWEVKPSTSCRKILWNAKKKRIKSKDEQRYF